MMTSRWLLFTDKTVRYGCEAAVNQSLVQCRQRSIDAFILLHTNNSVIFVNENCQKLKNNDLVNDN